MKKVRWSLIVLMYVITFYGFYLLLNFNDFSDYRNSFIYDLYAVFGLREFADTFGFVLLLIAVIIQLILISVSKLDTRMKRWIQLYSSVLPLVLVLDELSNLIWEPLLFYAILCILCGLPVFYWLYVRRSKLVMLLSGIVIGTIYYFIIYLTYWMSITTPVV